MTTRSRRTFLRGFSHPVLTATLLVGAVATLLLAYLVSTPMWLDEALSVNIARLPLGDLTGALRHDGHPPLYYALLHGWMALFGHGDGAVRAMSATISVATVPLVWLSARRRISERGALTAVLVFALSPFVLRYGSEARMYSLIVAEVFAGYLLVTANLDRRTGSRSVGVALVTAALLWTHYWSMWLVAALGMLLVVRLVLQWRRAGRSGIGATAATIGAIVAGGLLFVPWLPNLLYQSQHTGTPWAPAFRPSAMVFTALVGFAGGPYPEPQILMLVLVVLMVIGVGGRALGEWAVQVDVRGSAAGRELALVAVATLAVASIAGLASGMAFAPRYAAVVFPFAMLLVAAGLEAFPDGRARNGALIVFALMSATGLVVVFHNVRSQAGDAAARIEQAAADGLVVTCPDQLGPSVERALEGTGAETRSYPDLGDPRFVNWVDYEERNARNDPAAAARLTLDRAGSRPVFVVYRDDFLTLEGQCSRYVAELTKAREPKQLLEADDSNYESMNVLEFAPR